MNFKNLILTIENGVAVVQLNRPNALNALNSETIAELDAACDIFEKNRDVRVVIFTGGEKAFAAGADVTELADADPLAAYENAKNAHKVYDRIESLPMPTIAAVNGPALGGGCELALSCDFRIAGEGAIFGLPEITLGIIPGAGGTQRLTKLVGPSKAKEMIFFGTPVKAPQALEIGLVSKVVPDEEVIEEAKKMAEKLKARPGVALRFAKEAINIGVNTDMNTGKKFELSRFSLVFSTKDQKEGMKAFCEKRKACFRNE
jgi:enoyl-CoA hydratase/carnithine racemase